MYRIQHRETGCWLIIEGFGKNQRDAWVSRKDAKHATQFETADEAKAAAMQFGLTAKNYKITTNEKETNT